MNRDKMLQAIRQKCAAVIPSDHRWLTDNRLTHAQGGDKCMNCGKFESEGDGPCEKRVCMITLADVLLALGPRHLYASTGGGLVVFWLSQTSYEKNKSRLFDWSLLRDSLDSQADDTIAYLHKFLCQN